MEVEVEIVNFIVPEQICLHHHRILTIEEGAFKAFTRSDQINGSDWSTKIVLLQAIVVPEHGLARNAVWLSDIYIDEAGLVPKDWN